MFKRVLVLVLFLFGVFWWLTNRGDDVADTPNTEVAAEEVSTEEGAETETIEDDATEEAAETEATTEAETATTTETKTAVAPKLTTPVATVTTSNTATTAPVVVPVVTAPVAVTPSVPARTTDVKVYMYEWNVDLSSKTIPAGTVNFTVQNDGRFTHDFNVTGFGNLGKVMPSETRSFTVKLKAGEYEAFSERRQDYERGVAESFTVVQ